MTSPAEASMPGTLNDGLRREEFGVSYVFVAFVIFVFVRESLTATAG
jgi:hypothetical protein